jgi:A/G-specific adenine glycosylase
LTEYWTLEQKITLRRSLLEWYQQEGRTLPWRGESDIYRIWISEIMLQQTQVKTVISYYERWLEKFPTVEDLAHADLQEVLKLWEGLGYYARARNLHKPAQQIVDQFNGIFPTNLEYLLQLKGIGRTTAGGILSAATNQPISILDGNVKRVLARLVALENSPNKAIKLLWNLSDELLDRHYPREFNQALMDLGATLCTFKNPQCDRCPWQTSCQAFLLGEPTNFPKTVKKDPIPRKQFYVAVVQNADQKLLIQQRPLEGLLGGLWEFPNLETNNLKDLQAFLKTQFYIKAKKYEKLITINHAYTHFKLSLTVYLCQTLDPENLTADKQLWVEKQQLKNYPFSTAHLKIIDHLLNN